MQDDYGNYVDYLPSRLVRVTEGMRQRWHLEHYSESSSQQGDYEYSYFLWFTEN